MRTSFLVISLVVACSKPSSEQKAGSVAPPAATGSSGSSAAPAGSGSSAVPTAAAAVVGPTRSVSGELDVSGLMSGKFQWIKKDQTSPISCAWSAEKEIGGLHVDLSDGAGHLLKMTIDVPPTEAGVPRLDVTSSSLPAPLKAKLGFNMSGDGSGNMQVKFDTTLTENPDAEPAKKPGKKDNKPSGPSLTIKGTLDVTCPPKK